jgi:hypothetical protein
METEKENPTLEKIEEFLRQMIEQLEPIHRDPLGRGRPRILPAFCLWAGVMVCVLRGWNSQLKIWRLLHHKGLWSYPRFPISDQAVYKRLEEGGEAPLKSLFEQVNAVLQERLRPYQQELAPFASEVVVMDATTLDKVVQHLPLLRAAASEKTAKLAGKLAGVFDVRLQQWRYVEYIENPTENERVSAPALLEHLQRGALILMDMGFFSFPWFDQLTQEGYYWITRLQPKASYEVLHAYYQKGTTFDGLIGLGAYRADRARYAVRLITFQVGEISYRYITNVLNPRLLSLHEVAVLYARRWDIEMAFKLIKRELGLHLFWSAKKVVILQQIWAVLLISQILHALQLEIAAKAGVDPFDVSLSLLIDYLPDWNDVDFIALVVEQGRDAGFIRPSRRIRIQTPPIDLKEYRPPPPDLCLLRPPRYAHRRSDLD